MHEVASTIARLLLWCWLISVWKKEKDPDGADHGCHVTWLLYEYGAMVVIVAVKRKENCPARQAINSNSVASSRLSMLDKVWRVIGCDGLTNRGIVGGGRLCASSSLLR